MRLPYQREAAEATHISCRSGTQGSSDPASATEKQGGLHLEYSRLSCRHRFGSAKCIQARATVEETVAVDVVVEKAEGEGWEVDKRAVGEDDGSTADRSICVTSA